MTIREKRPFPVSSEVVMRSALFALANLNAKLQIYNEETGVIVATVTKWLGVQKDEVIVKVRRFDDTSILEVEAPDAQKAREILSQISAYVTDGAGRVQADATIQWVDVTRQREGQARRRELANKARSILPGQSTPEETLPAVIDAQGNEIIPAGEEAPASLIPIPENPGVLVKNYQDKVIELKVDPVVFADRTPYLEVCQACSATVMRGSKYCSSCGRPLTLEAVQPDLQEGAHKSSGSSLLAGIIAFLASLVPFLILILPLVIGGVDASLSFLEKLDQSLTPLRLVLSALLGVLPGFLFGYRAVTQSQQAGWYQNLDALFDQPGRLRSRTGRVLGWIAIYISAAWILFILVALLLG
ncbi:MAG: hypothetical protein ACK2T4_02075 [Candidatus Promineifilaceae bacterium]|jgi:hypothetical protein